jgi:hypothetical protein
VATLKLVKEIETYLLYFKRLFHTGVTDLGTILQLYNCRRKAEANIAVVVVS